MKKITIILLLLFSLNSFAQSLKFDIDKTKNVKYNAFFGNSNYLQIKTNDTTIYFMNPIMYNCAYASDDYFVFAKSCGTCCMNYSVLVLKPKIEWKYYDIPYYIDFDKHFFIKRNPKRNAIQYTDFLTGQIFWKRTITNKDFSLYTMSLSVDVKAEKIFVKILDVPDSLLIQPYKSNQTYIFKLSK